MSAFKDLTTQAQAGALGLSADPSAFVSLEKACIDRITAIAAIKKKVRTVADNEVWGIGEGAAVLTSAQTMVRRFREKGADGPNNAHDVLDEHQTTAREMLTLFRTIRQRLEEADSAFAAQFKQLATAAGIDTGSVK
ncbi:hypothetical protein [Nocardia camponoti]|uniref:Uncharacterized protein n=1 Tax=Nocardia camponoti TaxID=1616106 RepID=A0A917VEF2_9NOCA|nr:hypothetical protein [Nocardia camponoti]GGK67478.1 hypothetical protein GCM10011591_44550 [Nocardia camponoti]